MPNASSPRFEASTAEALFSDTTESASLLASGCSASSKVKPGNCADTGLELLSKRETDQDRCRFMTFVGTDAE